MMRTILLLLLIAAFVSNNFSQSGRRVSGSVSSAPIQPPLVKEPELVRAPEPAPELLVLPGKLLDHQIKSLDKGTFRLADFQGKILVINIWASWCGPCRREAPEYEKVRKAYAGKDVEFIGLTTEDPRAADAVNRFVRDVKFGFRLGWADREMARALMQGRNSIPQTLVIGASGRVVNHWTGYAPGRGADRLSEAIEHALLDAGQ